MYKNFIFIFFHFFIFVKNVNSAEFIGEFIQGHFIIGKTEPNFSVFIDKKKIKAYIGFDCTATSLHVGSLLQIMCLKLLQNHGHQPIVLLGDGTTRIGDPSGKDKTRKILTENEIRQVFPEHEKPTKSLQLVIKLMDSLVKEDFVDYKRLYLSGLSNGAMGSFELLKNRPNMFASAVLICGGGNPIWAKDFAKTTPVWVAHGSDDDVVFPELSINMVKAIIKHGGSPKFTLYENVNHESWFNVFNDPNYLKWMFSFTKN